MSLDVPEGRHHRAEAVAPESIELQWTETSDHRTVVTLTEARLLFGLGGTPDELMAQRVTGLLTACPEAMKPLDDSPHMCDVRSWRLTQVNDKPVTP